jgi:hypothetical protein
MPEQVFVKKVPIRSSSSRTPKRWSRLMLNMEATVIKMWDYDHKHSFIILTTHANFNFVYRAHHILVCLQLPQPSRYLGCEYKQPQIWRTSGNVLQLLSGIHLTSAMYSTSSQNKNRIDMNQDEIGLRVPHKDRNSLAWVLPTLSMCPSST